MTRGQGEGSLYQRRDGMWCASIELPEGLDGKRRRNPPPIGGMRSRITPNCAVSAVSIFRAKWAYFPVLARIFRVQSGLSQWGSNPPVSARGSPPTQGSWRASPHKPRKSPQDLLKLSQENP